MAEISKVMTAQEAIDRFVHDGDIIATGGFGTNRCPYAMSHEIIRQKKTHLILEGGSSCGDMDILIGSGLVDAMNVGYIANAGFSSVCRRFRNAVEKGELVYEDYSLDVLTIAYHAAALGLPFVPVKNMLGSDLAEKWRISEEERKNYPKLPPKKFIVMDDPFTGEKVCCIPTPKIDVAIIHAQLASPDGTVRIIGPEFQDVDIAIAAKHTIVTCEKVIDNAEMRRHAEKNTISGLCIDAVVELPYGAHPTQCFGYYDYDPQYLLEYEKASKTQEGFDEFIEKYVTSCETHFDYLDKIGAARLLKLRSTPGYNYIPGLSRR